jgi:general secretion pathway protein D
MLFARLIRRHTALLAALLLLHGPLALAQQQPQAPAPVPQMPLPPGFRPSYTPQQQAQEPPPQAPANQAAPTPAAPTPEAAGSLPGLNLQNVSLTEVIDYLARELKINYILDPLVKGGVTLNTYGEVKNIDRRALLDTILRINGAAMVQTGDIYRIVPLNDLAHMPLTPRQDDKNIAEDDQPMLNLVFLKYANAEELSKLLVEFLGPSGRVWGYPPANLLLVLDSRRNMKRTMEMVSLFDSDTLAQQRVRLFDVKNSRPTDLAKELENLMKSISLGKDLQSIRFVPVDRINVLIAVAPNPGVFEEVQKWIDKLDVKVKSAVGKTDTYVYRVKYGRTETLSQSIMSLYYSLSPYGMYGGGMYGGGMYGGGMYGGGMYGGMYGGYGGMAGYPGMSGYPGQAMTGLSGAGTSAVVSPNALSASTTGTGTSGVGGNLTGTYLGAGMYPGMGMGMYMPGGPRVVPNINDNSLLILATGEEYDSIVKLLEQLDVPPRQVLIEATIYEVTLTGAFTNGVTAYLRQKGTSTTDGPAGDFDRKLAGSLSSTGIGMSIGTLIGQSKELLAFLTSAETRDRTRVISSPKLIATDSVAASMNVGLDVPVLQSQAVTGAQASGSSLFANTVSTRQTGVTLNILARVNPSGIVTMEIKQEVSNPQAPGASSAIQSPSFSQRTISTQVTVSDGDTVAIGGIISESNGDSSAGVPYLHRIPILGAAFGARSTNHQRTELVVFLTPRVIYDTNGITEASDELTSKLRRLQRLIKQ